MSKTARMIMYPLLAVVVGFFLYTMFFMEPKQSPQGEGTATSELVDTPASATDTVAETK